MLMCIVYSNRSNMSLHNLCMNYLLIHTHTFLHKSFHNSHNTRSDIHWGKYLSMWSYSHRNIRFHN